MTSNLKVNSWPSIARFEAGNAGIPFLWSFAADAPGPHVMINALTHGNEPCGAMAVAGLLDDEVRPVRGRLTLSFANTLAYERFLEGRDLPARYLDRDLNRLWRDDWIDEDTSSREAARARELRPVLASVDTLLDLHSTATVSQPFLVLADLDKSRAIADAVAIPPCQQLMPGGCLDGRHMIDYGHFADPDDPAVAVTLECGQHDDPAAADVAQGVALRLLEVLDVVPAQAMQFDSKACAIRRLRTIEPYTVQSDRFEMCIRRGGFVSVRSGETVASDGGEDVVAPYDSIIVAPRPNPPAGATGFIWAVEVT